MFLFRTAFWLALVVLLLPTDAQQQEKLYKSVSSAAHQAATFCDRNGPTCVRAGELWAAFRQKLEFGARIALDVAAERLQGQPADKRSPARLDPASNTLTPGDMAPAWRRPQRTGA